jgi:phage tail protein X
MRFTLLVALTPILVYLSFFGMIRVSGRCFATTGARDIAALALAMIGLMAVGPAQLFFPRNAAVFFGPTVWLALALLFGLVVLLITMVVQPTLVVYGRTSTEVYDAVLKAALEIDAEAKGEPQNLQIYLPGIGVRLRCDGIDGHDFTRVLSFEPAFSRSLWDRLLGGIRKHLPSKPVNRRPQGWSQLLFCVISLVLLVAYAANSPAQVEEEFRRWLWR